MNNLGNVKNSENGADYSSVVSFVYSQLSSDSANSSEIQSQTLNKSNSSNYDVGVETFDYSSTTTAFSTPYHVIQEPYDNEKNYVLEYLKPDNPKFKEISEIVGNHLFHGELRDLIRFVDAVKIKNPKQQMNFHEHQTRLKTKSYPDDFTYLFMDVGPYDPSFEHRLFNKGLDVGNLPIFKFIESNSNNGVYLSKNVDTCTVAPLLPFIPHRLVIFKVLLGQTKEIISPINWTDFDDAENYGSIVLENIKPCLTDYDLFYQNLIHVYDASVFQDNFERKTVFHKPPRSVLPFIAVTFYISNIYSTMKLTNLPYLPKNKIGKYDLTFINLRTFKVDAFNLHDYSTIIPELAIDGIKIFKAVKIEDISRVTIIKDFLSNSSSETFLTSSKMKTGSIDSKYSFVYYLHHVTLFSDDPDLRKIIKRLRYDDQGLLFSVPDFLSEDVVKQQFGFILPNSSFCTMFGIPYFVADILHCFVLYRIPVTSTIHPLRTLYREETLMNLVDNVQMKRFNKISDNDVHYALSTLKSSQFSMETSSGKLNNSNSKELMVENGKEASTDDQQQDDSVFDMTDDEFNEAMNNANKEYEEMMKIANSYPIMLNDISNNNEHEREHEPKPTMKTLVLLEPTSMKDGFFEPKDLKTIMDLLLTRSGRRINTNFEVIYHDSIRSEKLANLSQDSLFEKLEEYSNLEEAYREKGLISYVDNHLCDTRSTNNARSILVCLLTLERKREFNNSVVISTLSLTNDDLTTLKNHKIFFVDPKTFIRLLKTGSNDFLY